MGLSAATREDIWDKLDMGVVPPLTAVRLSFGQQAQKLIVGNNSGELSGSLRFMVASVDWSGEPVRTAAAPPPCATDRQSRKINVFEKTNLQLQPSNAYASMEWAGNPNLPLLIVSKYALNVILTKN